MIATQSMNIHLETERLLLSPLTEADTLFIYELLNSKAWIRFIGDRDINTFDDADAYIDKILSGRNLQYWIVREKGKDKPIGLITFMKRAYLDHWDLGFAFLEKHGKKGYAFEATDAVLKTALQLKAHPIIVATTLPDNINSIKLLEKLGFKFDKKMKVEKDMLSIYTTQKD